MEISLKNKYLMAIMLLLFMIAITACQSSEVQVTEIVKEVEVTVVVEPTPLPPTPTDEPTPPPDQTEIQAAWESSPHNTYDLYHGPNTWCARCHSPQNWDPEATIGKPPNCFSCKFPTDDEVRIADGNDLIPEEEWKAVNCETCHIMEDGFAVEVAFYDPRSDNPINFTYEEVSNNTELCEKCHVTTTGTSSPLRSSVDHKITLGGSAHLDYVGFLGENPPPGECTDCHDPHSTEPKTCTDCHELNEGEHAKGMYPLMKDTVTCMACHEASGAEVGPHPAEDNDQWVTLLTEEGRRGPTTSAIISHSIVYEVSCDRCHFDENPWDLLILTAEGEVPTPEAEESGG